MHSQNTGFRMKVVFMYIGDHMGEQGFTDEVLCKAQDLLDDDFRTEEGVGFISDGDVVRMVSAPVWEAMRHLENSQQYATLH